MGEELKYQLRLTLNDPFARMARNHPDDSSIAVTTQVAGCGSRNPQVGDQAFWFCGESLEHIPALLFCR